MNTINYMIKKLKDQLKKGALKFNDYFSISSLTGETVSQSLANDEESLSTNALLPFFFFRNIHQCRGFALDQTNRLDEAVLRGCSELS
jgi:hypothetical protein